MDVLRQTYTEVTHTLEAQSVARNMFQCNALTQRELQSIQSQRFEPIKAAEQLINVVTNQSDNVFTWFLDALKKTNQQHVYEIIVTGRYRGTSDGVLL